jgi:hypothetical protein
MGSEPVTEVKDGDFVLSGQVTSGRNFGADVITQNRDRIKHLLGAYPYAGTLNIAMNNPLLLQHAAQIDKKGKQFAISGTIKGIPVLIYRWHGGPLHVVEVIASVHLRSTLGLKDGQMIDIAVSKDTVLSPPAWRSGLWRLFYQERSHAYYNDDMHKLFTGRYFKYLHKKVCRRRTI